MKRRKQSDNSQSQDNDGKSLIVNIHKSDISAQYLLSLDPERSGWLFKKNNSILRSILPCVFKKWQHRFFILIGSYLFRFSSEDSEKPKGVPIPLGTYELIKHSQIFILTFNLQIQ